MKPSVEAFAPDCLMLAALVAFDCNVMSTYGAKLGETAACALAVAADIAATAAIAVAARVSRVLRPVDFLVVLGILILSLIFRRIRAVIGS